jgi:hypothetical protein
LIFVVGFNFVTHARYCCCTMPDSGPLCAQSFATPSSQEGSTIETAVEIVRGVVPKPNSLRMHSELFRRRNHPSRHRKERDDAALLTQEGNLPAFTVTIIDT